MSSTLSLSLTDELRAYVDANSGEGTLYATPSEFLRDLLRQRKASEEALQVREKIVSGYQDAIAGRTVEYKGDLAAILNKAKQK